MSAIPMPVQSRARGSRGQHTSLSFDACSSQALVAVRKCVGRELASSFLTFQAAGLHVLL